MKNRETNNFLESLENLLATYSFEFKPTQNRISIPLVERLYKKMMAGLEFDAIKVAENLIIDGHHRYIAAVLSNTEITHFPSQQNHNQTSFDWAEITLTSIDYDKPIDVKYHNFNDAKRNGLSVVDIEKILNS
jgi:hypothetical protein